MSIGEHRHRWEGRWALGFLFLLFKNISLDNFLRYLISFIGNSKCRQLLKFTIKWNRYWQFFLTCDDIKNRPKTTFFCSECRGIMIVFEHWFTYATPPNYTRFKGIIKAFSGMGVRLTSMTLQVIWSSVLISVDNFSYFLFVIISICKYPVIQPMAAMVFIIKYLSITSCDDIGVVIPANWRHYLFYLQPYFSALGIVLFFNRSRELFCP